MSRSGIQTSLLVFIGCYVILNSGFMLLRLPPTGPGVPLGELVVVYGVFTLLLARSKRVAFLNHAPFLPLALFWAIGTTHLVLDVPNHGFWAFRDAAHLFETMFMWLGFRMAAEADTFPRLHRWLAALCLLTLIYVALYPFRDTLSAFSPQVRSPGNYALPLFFTYNNVSSGAVMASVFFLLETRERYRNLKLGLVLVAIVVVVTLVQVRVAYLQFAAAIALLCVLSPRSLARFAMLMPVAAVGILAFASSGLEFEGRLGTKFTLDFLWNHVQAIWGGGDESVQAAADGVDLRLVWWTDAQRLIFSDVWHMFFGVGFGIPLTTFEGPDGDITREPHNSFVSVATRYGFVGLACFLAIQALLLRTLYQSCKFAQTAQMPRLKQFLVTCAVFFAANLLFSFVEGGFEVSFVAIPYYFLAGIVFGIGRNLRHGVVAQYWHGK